MKTLSLTSRCNNCFFTQQSSLHNFFIFCVLQTVETQGARRISFLRLKNCEVAPLVFSACATWICQKRRKKTLPIVEYEISKAYRATLKAHRASLRLTNTSSPPAPAMCVSLSVASNCKKIHKFLFFQSHEASVCHFILLPLRVSIDIRNYERCFENYY